ncbi:MAG: hypothetical protein ABEI13_00275, partial [Candidatus Paceibacteria bacterium]
MVYSADTGALNPVNPTGQSTGEKQGGGQLPGGSPREGQSPGGSPKGGQSPGGSPRDESPGGDGRKKAARDAKGASAIAEALEETVKPKEKKSEALDLSKEQLSAVQRYLRGDNLTAAQKNTLRTIPISQWAKVAQTVDSTSSPLITFAVPPDNILRVTLYIRNNSRKVYSRNVYSRSSGEEVFVTPDVSNLNPETYSL